MNISIVGTGYVGLVSGTCFAELGSNVTCIDIDKVKIENLKKGIIPIYEPGLEGLVKRNISAGRLNFSTELNEVINKSDILFIAVGTPSGKDGSADLKYVIDVARTIGKSINNYLIVVTKSTVPVGTSYKIKSIISEEINKRGLNIDFDVASNPEFLKEGDAINDFMKPDRVIVGVDSERAKEVLTKLYQPMLLNNFRVYFMDIKSSEMTKYASNAMLATRISFMNDIANLCELVGADVDKVRKGVGSDSRIGSKFLYPGIGYGGSCFPKDVKALIKIGLDNNYVMSVLNAVEEVNQKQKTILFDKFKSHYKGNIEGKNVAIWGLAFKPGTDDIREAPSLLIIDKLINSGCNVSVYDPVAMAEVKKLYNDKIKYANDMYSATLNADTLMHLTEWKEFRMPNWGIIKRSMKPNPVVLDGRNVYNETDLIGIKYYKIG